MEWIISTALIHSSAKQDKTSTAPGAAKENQVAAGLKSILKKIGGGNDSDNQDNLKRWEHSMFTLKRHKGKKFYIFGLEHFYVFFKNKTRTVTDFSNVKVVAINLPKLNSIIYWNFPKLIVVRTFNGNTNQFL